LHACGHWLGYDSGFEGVRHTYMYDVIEATGEIDYYIPQILEMLRSDIEEFSHQQLYELVGVMAEHGHAEARRTLYEEFTKDVVHGWLLATYPIVRLDGIDGYVYIAEKLVQFPVAMDNEEGKRDEVYLLDDLIEQCGEEAVSTAIASANADVRAYYSRINEARTSRTPGKGRPPAPILAYSELRSLMEKEDPTRYKTTWWRYGQGATEETLQRLAADLAAEKERHSRIKILSLFFWRDFLGDIGPVIEMVKSEDEELRRAAVNVAERYTDPRIREIALDFIKSKSDICSGLSLLAANGSEADYPLFPNLISTQHSDDYHHALSTEIRYFIKANPSPSALPILVELYERGRCLMCRGSLIDLMCDIDRIPDYIRREARYDAAVDVRELVAKSIQS